MTTKHKKQKGSVLILTIMAVLILSVMVTGLLNVGTTEIYTTRNYQLVKTAYYTAVQGAEEIRNMVANPENSNIDVGQIKRSPTEINTNGAHLAGETGTYGTVIAEDGVERSYITGTLIDLENAYAAKTLTEMSEAANVSTPNPPEAGFDLTKEGTDLGGVSVSTIVWHVYVTSQVKAGSLVAYSEVVLGILQRISK
ncbi:MAG: hypothetical protein GY940_22420 [bacterium]|nr:hypothetical protein [bacterium]